MRKYKYKVFDVETQTYFDGTYTYTEIYDLIGLRAEYSKYAKEGWLLCRRYKIEFAEEPEVVEEAVSVVPVMWSYEWDRVRLEILRRGGKKV